MGFSFDPNTKHDTGGSLIPNNVAHFAVLTVRKVKSSNETGGEYADIELALCDGPYENRKVWPMVCNPDDTRNKEGWRKMGMAALQHICETAGLFNPAKPDSYARFATATFADLLREIDGKRVAVIISIEKGKDGHNDKNGIRAWLTPNPLSDNAKRWDALLKGEHGGEKPKAAAQTSFAGFGKEASALPTSPQPEAAGIATGNKPAWL
jgi:hypothetical protein